jgi:hypothetical protein
MHAVVDTAPEQLRRLFVGQAITGIVSEVALSEAGSVLILLSRRPAFRCRTLARRWEYLNAELVELDGQLDDLTVAAAQTSSASSPTGPPSSDSSAPCSPSNTTSGPSLAAA